MYQIKYKNGYTLCVTKGGNGGRVDDSHGKTRFEGTYDGAAKWLADRGVSEDHSGSSTAAGISETRRGNR